MTPKQSRFKPGDLVFAYHWSSALKDDYDFVGPYLVTGHHSSLAGWSYTLLNPKDGGLHRGIGEGLLRPWKHIGETGEKSEGTHVQIGADKL